MPNLPTALLILEDGSTFAGRSIGAPGEFAGPIVFNTSMTGHQEIVSDPACAGQMVAFTCPHVGNVGVNDEDDESPRPAAGAVLARALTEVPSNWRAERSFVEWLRAGGVPALTGLDTRRLTLLLRDKGALRGALSTENLDAGRLLAMARSAPAAPDLRTADASAPATWTAGLSPAWDPAVSLNETRETAPADPPHVVVLDCGAKENVLRHLVTLGARVTVAAADLSAQEILALRPDGVLISSGPGDPREATGAISAARELLGRVPLYGLGLGCQILALAAGARVVPLAAGHHGCNHPVRDLATGRIEITAQNHLFGIDAASLADLPLEATHVNLYDGTVEGLRHTWQEAWGVLYQPEASPGPHDALHALSEFVAATRRR